LHVALDSCGNVPWERFDRVLPFVDLVLFDLKIMDPEKHRAATGVDNTRALDNVRALAARGVPLWIRTPLIPGYTSDDDNLRAIGAFIREELATVQRWELLAYTNFGLPKYRRLGIPYLLESTPLMTQAQLEHAVDVARPFALDVRGVGETKTRSEASP
jgi:pyruvate formate lyase activating enzyme